jgi:glycogen debranching enzyme
MASSLDYTMLARSQMASILSVCEKKLLTEVGLRTLEREDPRYRGVYAGGFSEREGAYHNGSIWPWLLGPYARTYVRVHGRAGRKKMKTLLERFFKRTLGEGGVGYISELYDGDAPHTPRGCIAQAWSMAEPARAYFEDALGVKPPYEKEVV